MSDETLKAKYQPVVDVMQQFGTEIHNFHVQDGKLFLKATAPSELAKNRIWDAIKRVDPSFADLTHQIDAKPGEQKYTIKPGDTLSKISKQFYGDANQYMKIAKANGIANPDKIQAGATLTIPV